MTQKRVLVTGGHGFLGKHVVHKLWMRGYQDICVSDSRLYDLRRREDVQRMFRLFSPDIIIHAAARCGGIQACSASPAEFFYDNLMMGMEMLDVASDHNVEKFVQIGSVCAYPYDVPLPAREEDLWKGYPEKTNAPYGIAKRVLLTMGQAYRQQHSMNVIHLVPVNMYGPGDKFDAERCHVIPSLIRKAVEAKRTGAPLEVWGNGKASRDFLYVEDAADGIIAAMEHYDQPEPVNLATGVETRVQEVVGAIVSAVGFEGPIVWNTTALEGQPRRLFDTQRAANWFGWRAETYLIDGIKKTVEWYLAKRP